MTKHFHVTLWIPLMYCALFLIFWIRIYLNEAVSFEDWVLEKQANYAAESAVDEMLETGNLNQDYADGDFVTLEPSVALRDFNTTLSYDFGLVPTDDTLDSISLKNLRVFAVCVYDGIYIHYLQRSETTGVELKQSPKIPYFYTDDYGNQYCLTLDPDKGYWDYKEDSNYQLHFYDNYTTKPSEDRQTTAINNRVADLVNWGLWETYDNERRSDKAISLPAIGETVRGDQPVRSPTVIAVVEGFTKSYGTTTLAECIGGAQLEETDQIVGFRIKGCPFYSYVDPDTNTTYTGDEAIAQAGGLGSPKLQISKISGKFYARSSWWKNHSRVKNYIENTSDSKYFDDEYEAAKAGYNDIGLCE